MAADGSQPASPDVLEEMEDELLDMLEQAAEADAEPDRPANGSRDIGDSLSLDPEVAAALEAELFGGTDPIPDPDAGNLPSPDMSETELFGPEEEESTAKATGSVETETAGQSTAFDLNEGEEAERRAAAAPAETPDAAGAADREARREMDEGPYDAKTSRYTRDENGNLIHKWKVDYALRGGGGRAQCRDTDCLERHDQGGVRTIEKGCLRIARRVLMDQDEDGNGGTIHLMWFHARCIFNSFLRARKSTRIIESEFDIEGFDELKHEDKEMLRRIIEGNENLRNVRFRSFDEAGPMKTPQKRSADGGDGSDPLGSNATGGKKRKTQERILSIGDRVWTHFRCLPKDDGAAVPGAAVATAKSAKSELAVVRDEITAGHVIVQFESQEHEKERLEMYMSKRGKRIRGWLRYPRLFEGKKQRVPVNWIQFNRNPPALCGCKVQVWGHPCECGITCNRGSAVKVFGVGDIPY